MTFLIPYLFYQFIYFLTAIILKVLYIYKQLFKKVRKTLLFTLKHIERRELVTFWLKIKSNKSSKIQALKNFSSIAIISLIVFLFRIDVLKYDKYFLSELWIEDLHKVISYNFHNPFQNLEEVEGEYLLINFYSKLVNISPETALEAFGILQPIAIAIILIWTVNKLGKINSIIPLIIAAVFGLVLIISPINLHYITQHQSPLLALTFAIPLLIYIGNPKLLAPTNQLYFTYVFIAFLAIGLINVFVLLIIIPPFIVANLFQSAFLNLKRKLIVIAAFTSALGMLILIYSQLSNAFSLMHFLKINLIAVSSFTYAPHLIAPYTTILNYVAIASIISFIMLIVLSFRHKSYNKLCLSFLIYYLIMVALLHANLVMIDYDLLFKTMSVITPLIIGVNLIVVIKFVPQIINKQLGNFEHAITGMSLVLIIGVYFISEKKIESTTDLTSTHSKDILSIYTKISADFMPYSYAVVNTGNTQVLSTRSHFFMTYDEFNTTYVVRDSIYQLYQQDKKTLAKHPEYILPETVLFFKYKTKAIVPFTSKTQLQHLKNRGRKISTIYESEYVEVLEIINAPKSSKVVDLIFKSR